MNKPRGIDYGVDETPPLHLLILAGLQSIGIMMTPVVFALVLCKHAAASVEVTAAVVSFTMLAMAAATALQSLGKGNVGCGYLCPMHPTGAYLSPSLSAAAAGGLPLVFGMTMFAGFLQMAMSRFMQQLRPYFPTEIAGVVVLLVGMNNAAIGGGLFMQGSVASPTFWDAVFIGLLTLGSMVAFNIWTRGAMRAMSALIGTAIGYGTAALMGLVALDDFSRVGERDLIDLPHVGHLDWSFDVALTIPFIVAAIAATLRVVGVVTLCQRVNDADWVRPEMRSIRGGVFADGLGTVIAGFVGGFGLNVSPGCVALSAAAGITSRKVAYAIAAILAVAALFPAVTTGFAAMPRPVMAGAIVFTACFLIINGMQAITSRMLDSRKTIVVGLAVIGALVVEIFPQLFAGAPEFVKPIVDSSMVFGTLLALLLNLLFKIGLKQTVEMTYDPDGDDRGVLEGFLDDQGGKWGARRDIILRARFALQQVVEAVLDYCEVRAPIRVSASFDEFNLNLAITYQGALLELPDQRPSDLEIRDSEDGLRRLAGFMLRRNADRAQSEKAGETAVIRFHFHH